MADEAMFPPFEVAMMELVKLEVEATSLKKQAIKANQALTKKINDIRVQLANDDNVLAEDAILLVSRFIKRVVPLGTDCDTAVLEAIIQGQMLRTDAGSLNPTTSIRTHPLELKSVKFRDITIPNSRDDFGQIYMLFSPSDGYYRFTSSRNPDNPIWSAIVLIAGDISSVHYSDCDFHVDIGQGVEEVNIQMSSTAAATAFVYSLRKTTHEASRFDSWREPSAKVTRVSA